MFTSLKATGIFDEASSIPNTVPSSPAKSTWFQTVNVVAVVGTPTIRRTRGRCSKMTWSYGCGSKNNISLTVNIINASFFARFRIRLSITDTSSMKATLFVGDTTRIFTPSLLECGHYWTPKRLGIYFRGLISKLMGY